MGLMRKNYSKFIVEEKKSNGEGSNRQKSTDTPLTYAKINKKKQVTK